MLTALAVERAHRSGKRVLLSDGDGLYLRKQTRDGASWTLRYRFAGREHWLGHAIRGVEGTYDRHDYFKERGAALEGWTQLLIEAERGMRKVAPIRKEARSGFQR
ncbi:MAG: integrase family protein [Steroidobacteraceae bacterium]